VADFNVTEAERASSTSTRSNKIAASPRIPASRVTCRARACSRRCSRSSRGRWRAVPPRAVASTRSRSTSRSTPRTFSSSAAERSTALEKIIESRTGRRQIGFTKEEVEEGVADKLKKNPFVDVEPDDLLPLRPDPGAGGPPAGHRAARRARRRLTGPHPGRAEETPW